MIAIFISIISLILDGIFSCFLFFMKDDLSLFTTLFTVVSVYMIYPLYMKKRKAYYIHIFILGILYDLFYTNLLFLDGLLFLGIGYLSEILYKNMDRNFFKNIYLIIIIITIYESMIGLILFTFQLVPIHIYQIFYKISHSIISNIIYGEVLYLILKWVPKKFKKISIN